MRSDLPRGIQAAQIVHAAGESSPGSIPIDTHAVVLTCSSAGELRDVRDRLERAGVAHVLVEEPDAPYFGAPMAIGVVPGRKEVLRRLLSSLPLLC